ncbi:MAG: PAS domain S-box protein [Acidobacteriota bacterium]
MSFDLFSFLSNLGLKSVKKKLVLVSIIITGFSILLTCVIAYRSFFNAIDSSGNLKKSSQSMMETVDLLVFENIQFVRTIANDQFIREKVEQSALTAEKLSINSQPGVQQIATLEEQFKQTHTLDDKSWETSEFLREKSHLKGVFDRMFFTDRYGLTVGMSSMTEDFVQSDEQWWQKAMKNGYYLSDLSLDKVTGTWEIEICVAIPHPKTGQPNGVLKTAYNLQDVQDYISRFKEYDSGFAYVINRDGNIILHPEIDRRGKSAPEKIRKSTNVDAGTNKISGLFNFDGINPVTKENELRLVSFQQSRGAGNNSFTFPGFGWVLMVDNSYNEVYAPATRMLSSIIITGLILFAIFGGFSLIFANSFSAAIQNLHQTTEEVIDGNLSARAKITTGDELEKVGDGFNQMLSRLEEMVNVEVEQKLALMGITQAIESCQDAIFIFDTTKETYYCNKKFTDTFGYTAEEIKDGEGLSLLCKDQQLVSDINLHLNSQTSWNGEVQMLTAGGKEILVALRADSISDEHGQVIEHIGILSDITESKLKEKELRLSQERFSKIFNFSPLSMSINNARGKYQEVNDHFLITTGYTREEAIGKSATELNLISPDDQEKINQLVKENGSFRNLELLYRTKQGEVRIILYSGVAINIDGEVYFIGVSNDVTELKQSEKELRLTEERFSKTFNFCPLIMTINRLNDGTFIDVNDTFLQASGYTRLEVLSSTIQELNLYSAKDLNKLQKMLNDSTSFRNTEIVLHTKTGETRTVLLSAEVFYLDEEPCVLNVATDITERKLIEKQVENELAEFLTLATKVSEGDLTGRGNESEEAVGRVVQLVNKMLDHFSQMLVQVKQIGLSVSSSAIEILAASEQMAVGAQRQADEITNTSSAVEEMAASMTQVSKNSQASADAARQAYMLAERGGESVRYTVDAMGRIISAVQMTSEKMRSLGQRSNEISEILDLIDEIAAQTNLLALNAAIEAAHAGQAGVGFSVVAEEIRKLAERSAKATKDVGNLIKSIQKETAEAQEAMSKGIHEVEDGSRVAEQASGALKDISAAVNLSADLIEEISTAADEQARVTRNLSSAMQTISSITIETSAGAHETAQTIQGMVTLSEQLNEAISRFRVRGELEGHYSFNYPPQGDDNLGGGYTPMRY